jgi:hypothetical protein
MTWLLVTSRSANRPHHWSAVSLRQTEVRSSCCRKDGTSENSNKSSLVLLRQMHCTIPYKAMCCVCKYWFLQPLYSELWGSWVKRLSLETCLANCYTADCLGLQPYGAQRKNNEQLRSVADCSTFYTRRCGFIQAGPVDRRLQAVQALGVPGGWGSRISRQSAHEGGKVVSPTHRPCVTPGRIFGTHLLEDESTRGPQCDRKN